LIEAQAWYEARSEVAAQAFALEIDHAIERILDTPFVTPAANVASDASYLDRFPYTILYRASEDHVFSTAVAHQRRRPDYWRHRRNS
jgi:plasmid stabilization system protein ParE